MDTTLQMVYNSVNLVLQIRKLPKCFTGDTWSLHLNTYLGRQQDLQRKSGREVHGHHQETNRQPCCSRLASYDHDCLSGFYSVSKTAPLLWHTDTGTPRGGRPGSGKCTKSRFWADTSGFCGHSKVTLLPRPCPHRHRSRPPSVPTTIGPSCGQRLPRDEAGRPLSVIPRCNNLFPCSSKWGIFSFIKRHTAQGTWRVKSAHFLTSRFGVARCRGIEPLTNPNVSWMVNFKLEKLSFN